MTNTTKLTDKASDLGREHGYAAGSWVVDGNTDEATVRKLIEQSEAGDPEFYERCPAPLSGEWADGLTPDQLLRDELELDLETLDEHDRQDLLDVYEASFSSAWEDEVVRAAQAML